MKMLCTGCKIAQARIEQAGLTIPHLRIRFAQVCAFATLVVLVTSVGLVVFQHCHILALELPLCVAVMGGVVSVIIASFYVFTSLGHYASAEMWITHQRGELEQEALRSLYKLRKQRERAKS